ncbi:TonB-dependent receptor [Kangiella sp. HZ709]|uniref:TonB-dependent receptor n=1 Tax=Kangiella sp. HZ709 TaxID=2666328 RepID=UPI0012AF1EFD|nr:TonB-dependent receptor [Kangiella sp. HZ709]MRX27168.1 TonB-dependent receptor [Kangiella sp. HZ709]
MDTFISQLKSKSVTFLYSLFAIFLIGTTASVKSSPQNDGESESSAIEKTSEQDNETNIIIVTVERNPSKKTSQAVSISHLTELELERLDALHPANLLNRLPNVFVQQGSGQEHLTAIRSPVFTGGAGAGSFLYLQDGIPLRSAGFANVNGLLDAQVGLAKQIEVVRGPGDVTYGSNAIHGIFNVLTADPLKIHDNSVNLFLSEFDRYDFSWQAGKANTDSGIIAGLQVFQDGGYRDESEVAQVKGQFGYGYSTPEYDMRLRLSLHHLEQETAGFVIGDNALENELLRRTNPNPEAFRDLEHALISAEFDIHNFGAWQAIITPYARWAEMSFLMHFLPSKALEENNHSSIGFLSQFRRSLNERLELLVGLDWEYSDGSLTETQSIPDVFSFTQGLHYDYRVTSNEVAPFARLRWQPAQDWQLQAGVRINHSRYRYDNKTDSDIIGRFLRPADRVDDFTTVTSKLAAIYKATQADFLFASLARGARAPQTTDLYRLQRNQTVGEADGETLDSLEVGWRHIKNNYQFEVTAYTMYKRNFFFRDADGFNVTNGKTSHRGIEIATAIDVHDALNWQTSVSYGLHQYDFDREVMRDSEVIVAGNDIDTAPRWLLNSRLLWDINSNLQTELELVHVDDYYTDAANSNFYQGHTISNLRLNWEPKPELKFFLTVRNITDKRYATRADFAFGNERYFPGEERNLTVGVKYKY